MYSLVFVTCPAGSAERIAREVLRLRLAACVNIIGKVRSRYWWKGKLASTDESMLLIKTKTELFEKLEGVIRRMHPYEVPEIIGIRITGSKSYLGWITEETQPSKKHVDRG